MLLHLAHLDILFLPSRAHDSVQTRAAAKKSEPRPVGEHVTPRHQCPTTGPVQRSQRLQRAPLRLDALHTLNGQRARPRTGTRLPDERVAQTVERRHLAAHQRTQRRRTRRDGEQRLADARR